MRTVYKCNTINAALHP